MSRENVEVVRATWAAYARGDYDASLRAYAENSVWDDVARTWRGTWERYDIEAEDVLDAGADRVAVVLCETGEGKGGGVALANRWGVVATVRDGKIVHTMVYRTPAEALEAVGRGQ